MYEAADITSVHLEVTTKCNAACPQCGRHWKGGILKPFLPLVELSLSDIQTILPPDFVRQLEYLYVCGSYGDAIMAKDTLEIFRYLQNSNPFIRLSLHTNGSAQKPEWWGTLAEVLGPTGCVYFGIDGLEDTNHIYRRRTSWKRIMENVNAFIQCGGIASWDYIVFRHNQHQVEQAETLSRKMGFENFVPKRTERFYNWVEGLAVDHFVVNDQDGQELYRLELPTDPKYIHSDQSDIPSVIDEFGSMEKFLKITPITCQYQQKQRIFISATGHIFPCCWTHGTILNQQQQTSQTKALIDNIGGMDTINALKHPMADIIQKFHQRMPEYWKSGENRFQVCGRRCGQSGGCKDKARITNTGVA